MAANTYSCDFEAGSSQYTWKDEPTGLDITGDITVELWLKPETLTDGMTFLSMDAAGDASENDNILFRVRCVTAADGTVGWIHEYDVGSNEIVNGTETGVVADTTWVHLALVRDTGNNKIKFYKNGVWLEDVAYTNEATGGTSGDFQLGACESNTSNYYDGLIDEVRIWNDIRTANEILTNYKVDVTGQTGLVGYWKLNNDYVDVVGVNNLTAGAGGAAPAFSTTVPFANYVPKSGFLAFM